MLWTRRGILLDEEECQRLLAQLVVAVGDTGVDAKRRWRSARAEIERREALFLNPGGFRTLRAAAIHSVYQDVIGGHL